MYFYCPSYEYLRNTHFFKLSRISLKSITSSGVGAASGVSIIRTLLTIFTIWKITNASKMKLIEIVMKLP
jgi:hypothetical protein